MTDQTPVERAAEAVYKTGPGYDLTGEKPWEELSTSSQDSAMRNARAAFNSIDTDQLANALLDVRSKEIPALTILGSDHEGDRLDALELAHAVKNWLTGKDT